MHIGEARGFVAASADRYDLIQIPLLDAFAAAAAGTVSLQRELRLHDRGVRDLSRSPCARRLSRDHPLAEAAAARQREAVSDGAAGSGAPGRRRAGAPARPDPQLGDHDAAGQERRPDARGRRADPRLRRRSARSISPSYPGMRADEANRYNLLEQPYFFEAAQGLIEDPAGVPRPVQVRPRGPRPTTGRISSISSSGRRCRSCGPCRRNPAARLLDWGYLILTATLVQAALLSLVLILLPLWLGRERGAARRPLAHRGLFRRDRPRLPVHRDRLDPALHPVPRPPALRDRRGARGLSGVRRARQRLRPGPRAAPRRPAHRRARLRDRRDRAARDPLHPRLCRPCSPR